VHGTAIVGFCGLCQLVLAYGTPSENQANVLEYGGVPYVFCSRVCRAIFEDEPERYAGHKDLVKRVLAGEAPGNLLAFLRFSGLTFEDWGKDAHGGDYDFLRRAQRS
ncbi:MAG TPA: YHS domain-containing protein, partial [Polyangiaceae bacterium]